MKVDHTPIEQNAEQEVPVLFLIFNRPAMTRLVFEAIRSARPRRLYVAADGPRPNAVGERERCADARRIATDVDWPCRLQTRFQESNVGLAIQVSSALDWFFANEEQGIVLEDDCVPDPTFFRYCAELLRHYRDVPDVMHVSGAKFQYGRRFKHSDIVPLIERLKNKNIFKVDKAGKSIEGRDIYLVSFGTGKTKVFLWSQMHGDEPTATAALFDMFNFFADDHSFADFKKYLLFTNSCLPIVSFKFSESQAAVIRKASKQTTL